ncbi:hypothetical protein ANO11243_048950 [Dothideomycetidae sp. 11243]|nr:hypothetical protein ANO11243_048950 [fungal sp. No.11243]
MNSIEQLHDIQVPDGPRLSPDAKRVIYETKCASGLRKSDNFVASIWIADVGLEKSARQLTSGQYNDENPQWAPDGSSIFFQSDRHSPGKKMAIYQLHLSGGEPISITDLDSEQPISRFAISPDGKFIAYTKPEEVTQDKVRRNEEEGGANIFGEDWDFNRLHIIHLQTRTTELLVKGDFEITDLVWSPDSKSLVIPVRNTPEFESGFFDGSSLKLVSVTNKKVSDICHFEHAPINEEKRIGLHWVSDRIHVVCNAATGTTISSEAIYSVSIEDGSWRHERGGDAFCASDLCAYGDGTLAKVKNDLYDELRTESDEIIFRDVCEVTAFDAAKCSSNSPNITVAVIKSTIDQPNEVYSFTTSSSKLIQLSNHSATISDRVGIAIEVHTLSHDDKVELDGIFFAPRDACTNGFPKKPLKTFVQPHGGPYMRVTSNFWPGNGWVQTLLRAGYAVLSPNYRGGAGHGRSFAESYLCGEHDHDDIIAVTQEAISRGLADANNLIIGGWSQGGLLTYLAAVRNGAHGLGWRFRGAIAGAGYCECDMLVLTNDMPRFQAPISGGAPWEHDADWTGSRQGSALWEFRAAADAGRIPPMLLLHGELDQRVPVTQAWAFQRACRSRGLPCQMVTYPRAGHLLREKKQLIDMHRRVLKFCDEHFD